MADYWAKIYIEILDDPKMATLPDRIWRRFIELILCAKKLGKGGHLPDTRQLAWMLRMNPDDLEADLMQISPTGIVVQEVGGWFIPKFEKRQGPATDTERKQRSRERQHKQQYYGSVTQETRKSYNNVTNVSRFVTQSTEDRLTEAEAEAEADSPAPAPAPVFVPSAERIFCDVTRMATFPGDALQYINTVEAMRETYGLERTVKAMKHQFEIWKMTKRKDGNGYYSPLNLAWIDRAQAELASSTTPNIDPSEMTSDQYYEYLMSKPNGTSDSIPS